MFDKTDIKEHMDVTDSVGRHVGTVDSVDGDSIKLARHDAPDNQHHRVSFDDVDRIADGHIYLKEGRDPHFGGAPGSSGFAGSIGLAGALGMEAGAEASEGSDAQDKKGVGDYPEGYAGETTSTSTGGSAPLFGTAGFGTGQGGGGGGQN